MPARRSHLASLVLFAATLAALASVAQPAAAQDRGRSLGTPLLGATIPPWTPTPAPTPSVDPQWQAWDPAYQMQSAELHAAPGGHRVLAAAQSMIEQGRVVRGSCYDWVDAVFEQAGGRRHDAFHGRISGGPYAQVQDFRPGDWVLFVNTSFGGDTSHTHSAIFIGWADESARVAVMMSYPGGRRSEPGRYGTYELTQAYRIIRMEDAGPTVRRHRRRH